MIPTVGGPLASIPEEGGILRPATGVFTATLDGLAGVRIVVSDAPVFG